MFAGVIVAAVSVAVGGEYDGYEDWQWQPVHVADSNAADTVRFEIDMTVPVHGPWLTLPAETAMTVTWITRVPCAGGIEYWEKGTTNRVERWPARMGQLDYTREVQSFRLTGLKPGATYEYRLLSHADKYTTPWTYYVGRGRETFSFKTVDPKRDSYRVFVTADLHGGARLALTPMYERTGAKDADFYFFLGDNVSDGAYNNYRFYATMGFLDDITRLWGKEKASVILRGNHDITGSDAMRHAELFPQPGDKTYYAFRQGPCLFVTMDTMWPPKEQLQQRRLGRSLQRGIILAAILVHQFFFSGQQEIAVAFCSPTGLPHQSIISFLGFLPGVPYRCIQHSLRLIALLLQLGVARQRV